MNPKISIIVPCYNQAQYLDECLQSVLNQTFISWECIIVDDGSPDNTEEVAKKWVEKDFRFKYIAQPNKGVSAARNLGITNAIGKYIQFLDGDDILECRKLEYQFLILETDDKIDIVYGGSRYFINGNCSDLYALHPRGIVPSIDLHYSDKNQLNVLLIRNVSTICATLYRKQIFERIKFKNTIYEDYLLHIEMAFENFIFHFSSAEEGNCLIRITEDSQMVKHIKDECNGSIFIDEVKRIKAINNSEFGRSQNSEIKIELKKRHFFKTLIYNFIPPILIFGLKRITKK